MTSIRDIAQRFSWEQGRSLHLDGKEVLEEEAAGRRLSDMIYRRFHAKASDVAPNGAGPDWQLFEALVDATPFRKVAEPDWTLRGSRDDVHVVERDGIRVAAKEDELVPSPIGSTVSVLVPAWRPHLSLGYFVLSGNAGALEGDVSRIYFSGGTDSGVPLVRALTRADFIHSIPWSFKVLGTRAELERADAAVLYVPAASLDPVLEEVRELARALPIGTSISDFVCPAAPGVGWAHDPGGKVSFGQFISDLLAEGVTRAREGGAVHDSVEAVFREREVDIDAPWLGPFMQGRDGAPTSP